MTGEALCQGCYRPTGDGALACRSCEAALVQLLTEAPVLLAELDVTITRQDRIGGAGGGKAQAVAFDVKASAARDALALYPSAG